MNNLKTMRVLFWGFTALAVLASCYFLVSIYFDVNEDIPQLTLPATSHARTTLNSDPFRLQNNETLPKTIYYDTFIFPYENVGRALGQQFIDEHRNESAATWGGTETFSGNDEKNTHFIGHNPGIFENLLCVQQNGIGKILTVTDEVGRPTHYQIDRIAIVDHYGREVSNGADLLHYITCELGGERVTLQTCLNDTENLIVFAKILRKPFTEF